jgi:hypothetical protein
MKLAVLTCAIYPTRTEAEQKLRFFMASCAKAGVEREDVHLYGIGRDFHRTDWRTKKLIYQLDYLKEMPTDYTHILYSDGGDAVLCGHINEVIHKYHAFRSPSMICSAAPFIANGQDAFWQTWQYDGCFDNSITNRYPHVGGYIAERDYVTGAFERMLKLPRQTWDDCWNWMDAWKEGWFRPVLDSNCEIFFVTDTEPVIKDSRVVVGESRPNVIHLSGGYADQVTWKDYKMEPLARSLGIL